MYLFETKELNEYIIIDILIYQYIIDNIYDILYIFCFCSLGRDKAF